MGEASQRELCVKSAGVVVFVMLIFVCYPFESAVNAQLTDKFK